MRLLPIALVVAALAPGAAPGTIAMDSRGRAIRADVPGSRIPVVRERRYEMSGAVRPLLFWIGRDDIGLARIVWRRDPAGGRGYELLVGTDPRKAPRALNRWGFITEEATGNGGALLALMTGSHETSYDNEAATAARGAGDGDFRAILSRVESGSVGWTLARVVSPEALTVHDVERALGAVAEQTQGTAARRRALPPAVRPGFLLAVADLLDAAVANAAGAGYTSTAPSPVQYVFGERTYELRVKRLDRQAQAFRGGSVPALKVAFETRTLATGARSEFTITAGTAGEAAGVPLEIQWQPRWWLKVRLTLRDPQAAAARREP